MARTETTGRHRPGPRRLLFPAATMAGLALVASFAATRVMDRVLSAQGGEAVEPLAALEGMDTHREATPRPLSRADYASAILGRNVFD